jgi:hypothetical protein
LCRSVVSRWETGMRDAIEKVKPGASAPASGASR